MKVRLLAASGVMLVAALAGCAPAPAPAPHPATPAAAAGPRPVPPRPPGSPPLPKCEAGMMGDCTK